jgi:hypothetical protein
MAAVLLANCAFVLTAYITPVDHSVIRERVRYAFETGELGFRDFVYFNRAGYNQFSDCNILQMLANPSASRLDRALSPVMYTDGSGTNDQCWVLYRAVVERADSSELMESRYSRYWHGYFVPVALALRLVEIRTLRRLILGAVWLCIAVFALVTFRSGVAVRRTGLAIATTAALFWAVPFFAPNFPHGIGDAVMIVGLIVMAARPHLALRADTLLPYSAAFAAVVVYFEMLTGQLPIAAAWLVVLSAAVRRDHEANKNADAVPVAVAVLIAFAVGGVITVAVKQILALGLTDPRAGRSFFAHVVYYSGISDASGSNPSVFQAFVRMVQQASVLTYGRLRAGYLLAGSTTLVWLMAAVRTIRRHRVERSDERLVVLAAAVIPLLWVLVLPTHSYIHAPFMVRIFVASISLAPLALVWPAARITSNRGAAAKV